MDAAFPVLRRAFPVILRMSLYAGILAAVIALLRLLLRRAPRRIVAAAIVVCIAVAVCFLTNPAATGLPDSLRAAMDQAVLDANRSSDADGRFCTADYDVLRIKKAGGKTTVYAWIYYGEYSCDGSDVTEHTASDIPSVLTFDTGKSGALFELIDYWIPRDGAYYPGDIREKFPITLWPKAFDNAGASKRAARCLAAAQRYYRAASAALAKRPTLKMDGVYYVDPFMPISYLPEGYGYAGTLSAEQADNTGLEGTKYYTNPGDLRDFYTYQLCATPTGLNEVDSERMTWQYLRWIRWDMEQRTMRTLTLDDVRRLAEKGGELTRDDLALYDYEEVGSGLYIRSYPIDGRFHLLVGALSNDGEPIYYYLRNKETDDWIDIRTDDVDAFLHGQGRNLDTLRSQFPEYFDLPTDDGLTVCVWQMAENSYSCALVAGTVPDEQTLWSITGVSLEEMRAILSAYDVGPEMISVEAIRMPHSSYYYDIDEAYIRSVRTLLLGEE